MMKILINGKEIELPKELTPIFENIVKTNIGKVLEQNKQIIPPQFPFRHPRLRLSEQRTSQDKNPIEDIFKYLGLNLEEPMIPNLPHKGKIGIAIFDIDKKVKDLEERIVRLEDILIRKQLEEEKANIKPLIKKKIILNIKTTPKVNKKTLVKQPIKQAHQKPIIKQPIKQAHQKPIIKKPIIKQPVIKQPVIKQPIKSSKKRVLKKTKLDKKK